MIIFDGKSLADQKEAELKARLAALVAKRPEVKVNIAAILFAEDAGSVLYTRLKQEAAQRVGISYQIHTFSITTGVEQVMTQIRTLNEDPTITGIIIQKPSRRIWQSASLVQGELKDIRQAFGAWWLLLTSQIALEKDVDGLHPKTLAAIEVGNWQEQGKVMPATAKAVLTILEQAKLDGTDLWRWLQTQKVAILGKSDILGQPLFYEFKNHEVAVELLGSTELQRKVEQGKSLFDFTIVISATGRPGLVTGELLGSSVILIDVGEPQPDVDVATLENKVSFLTPVPGGVGPLTVVSLLENAVVLVKKT